MADRQRILVVDDDRDLVRLLTLRLGAAGFEVEAVSSGMEALDHLPAFQPHLVLTDLRMEGMDGIALFDAIRERHPTLPVVILTAYGTIPDAIEATRRGVSGYLTKPFESRELVAHLGKLLRVAGGGEGGFEDSTQERWREDIVSRSEAMREMLDRALRAARSDANILIQSPSGTGKELLAKAIHRASERAGQPFVPIDCSAIPESLLESELFGHTKGSFTGASQPRRGLVQAADGGTLFLDEVGDMPVGAQAKLLRVLEEREVRPLGSTTSVAVDVRVVAATHRDLERRIEEQAFREDLFYRLNVVKLELPPLAARREDIAPLANHFLQGIGGRSAVPVTAFAPEAMELLVAAPWPGNVRQLRNVVEQCAVLTPTPVIPESLVRKSLGGSPRELLSFAEARHRFEHDYLVTLLQMTEGNVSQAARLAERNRSEFYKLLRRHRLDPELFRPPSDEP
jgi:two-component system, NtrC family, response regulator GlrR